MLVDELLVVGDEGLGNGLTDGVDLRSVTTAGDADADVNVGELIEADDQDGLVDLVSGLAWLLRMDGSLVCEDCSRSGEVKNLHPSPKFGDEKRIDLSRQPGLRVVFGVWNMEEIPTLKRRTSGWTSWRGRPLTLMRPWPACEIQVSIFH